MTKDEAKKFYLKGYERGWKDAIADVLKLTSRGYGPTELSVVLKTKALDKAVQDMDRKIEAGDVDLGIEAPTLGALRGRGSYLVREARGEQVFALLQGLTAKEARPLCISRTHPKELAAIGLRAENCVWLTRQSEKEITCASPTDLVALTTAIHRHVEGGNAAVVIEGLEYLASQNGFPAVLRFVQAIHEKVVSGDSYLLMSADPDAFKEADYRQLARGVTAEL
ncbi:MAG TPA: DUF835 domain-containing protein [Thermoplasmata archaeon]|jgi:hypothetical protein|nr:DUF835 domain-containing protein [Thermoplasmata archaeon]